MSSYEKLSDYQPKPPRMEPAPEVEIPSEEDATEKDIRQLLSAYEFEGLGEILLRKHPELTISILVQDFLRPPPATGKKAAPHFLKKLLPLRIDSETDLLALNLRNQLAWTEEDADIATEEQERQHRLMLLISTASRAHESGEASYCASHLAGAVAAHEVTMEEIHRAYQALSEGGYVDAEGEERFLTEIEAAARRYNRDVAATLEESKKGIFKWRAEEANEQRIKLLLDSTAREDIRRMAADIVSQGDQLKYVRARLVQIIYTEKEHTVTERHRAQERLQQIETAVQSAFKKDPAAFLSEYLTSFRVGKEWDFVDQQLAWFDVTGNEEVANALYAATKEPLFRQEALTRMSRIALANPPGKPISIRVMKMLEEGETSEEELEEFLHSIEEATGIEENQAENNQPAERKPVRTLLEAKAAILDPHQLEGLPILVKSFEDADTAPERILKMVQEFRDRAVIERVKKAKELAQTLGIPASQEKIKRIERQVIEQLKNTDAWKIVEKYEGYYFKHLQETRPWWYMDLKNDSVAPVDLAAYTLFIHELARGLTAEEQEPLRFYFPMILDKLMGFTPVMRTRYEKGTAQVTEITGPYTPINRFVEEPGIPEFGAPPFTNMEADTYCKLFEPFEAAGLAYKDMKKAIADQLLTYWKTKVFKDQGGGAYGDMEGYDGNIYEAPNEASVLERLLQNKELVLQAANQGFKDIVIVPHAVSINTLMRAYEDLAEEALKRNRREFQRKKQVTHYPAQSTTDFISVDQFKIVLPQDNGGNPGGMTEEEYIQKFGTFSVLLKKENLDWKMYTLSKIDDHFVKPPGTRNQPGSLEECTLNTKEFLAAVTHKITDTDHSLLSRYIDDIYLTDLLYIVDQTNFAGFPYAFTWDEQNCLLKIDPQHFLALGAKTGHYVYLTGIRLPVHKHPN